MRSSAKTVEQYLAELPDDRRQALSTVREAILASLPDGYVEAMNWGMIAYQVPLEAYDETYNGQPLMYAALASQKRHMAVYLSGIYASEERRERFETAYKATGKRFDVGKSCVRFRTIDDLPVDLIGETIASMEPGELIARAKEARATRSRTTEPAERASSADP